MGSWFRIARLVLAVLVVVALAGGLWKREELQRLWAVNTLFDEDRIVANFSDMDRMFLTAQVPRGDLPVTPLPQGEPVELPAEVFDWIEARDVTAMVVLHDGDIVFEDYFLGTGPDDVRIVWSVGKSYLSALAGVLLYEGAIGSLDDPVTKYAPELNGGAYDRVTVRDVLNMTSGVVFDENYSDRSSDINRMGRVLALGRSMDGFAAALTETSAAPGETWRYVSIDSHVLGMVLRGATGRSIPDLMSEKIVAPMGFEAEPYYVTDGYGVAFVLGGLNTTTRDTARFGLTYLNGGRLGGRQIVPEAWVEETTRPSGRGPQSGIEYSFQWWVPPDAADGEFFAEGLYGQYLYVNRPLGTVIAVNAADREFRGKALSNVEVFRGIASAVVAAADLVSAEP